MSLSRQLAAILFTDIKDFSQMMEENEPKASVIREKVMHAVTPRYHSVRGRYSCTVWQNEFYKWFREAL
jgi:hypothetical protein